MGADSCLVHLVWAPLGAPVVERFVQAYRAQPAGLEHRLVTVMNGFDGASDPRLAAVEAALGQVEHESIVLADPVLDLAAYRQAAIELDALRICFVNSYSRPLTGGWLAKLAAPLLDGRAALTGVAGSQESAITAAPLWLRHRRRGFPPFPNPHVRTNGFMIERALLLDLRWPAFDSKLATLAFESGVDSLTRQVSQRGDAVVVVGRDGVAYPPEEWQESATFRSGAQRNLLLADNRTEQYEHATDALKRRLEEMAWGVSSVA